MCIYYLDIIICCLIKFGYIDIYFMCYILNNRSEYRYYNNVDDEILFINNNNNNILINNIIHFISLNKYILQYLVD